MRRRPLSSWAQRSRHSPPLAARADASEVLVSQTVKYLVPGSGLAFEDADEHELKGAPDRWHLYRVVSERT
jgi:class 3 adenylate cyclase